MNYTVFKLQVCQILTDRLQHAMDKKYNSQIKNMYMMLYIFVKQTNWIVINLILIYNKYYTHYILFFSQLCNLSEI